MAENNEDRDDTTVTLRSSMLTDVGVVREHNEDSAHMDAAFRFFVVADGMGGHAAGEVASAMAVQSVRETLEKAESQLEDFAANPSEDGRQKLAAVLEAAVREAHRSVYDRGISEADKQGMGTTLDVVLVAGPEAFVAHVGDSRTYLIRDGRAAQITTDHTVAEVLVIEGKLSAEEAAVSPLRTILVNAIGVAPEVGVEMAHLRLHQGDRLLLCSDGLHDYFPHEDELQEHVSTREPAAALSELIELAKNRGGHDNITGVLIEVLKAPARHEPVTAPLPVLQTSSDGVPVAISRDDTLPVEARQGAKQSDGADGKATVPVRIAPLDEPTEPAASIPEEGLPTVPLRIQPSSNTEELAAASTLDLPMPSSDEDDEDDESDEDDDEDDLVNAPTPPADADRSAADRAVVQTEKRSKS